MLGQGGSANCQTGSHALAGFCHPGGQDQPAQTPARHVEVLGKAIDNNNVLIQGQGAERCFFIKQTQINLVHDDEAITGAHFLDQFLQGRAGNRCAGGIVWRRNQNAAGLGTPVLANMLGT